jgi:muramoyltetrapeptide carboxypeptidase
MVKFPPYLKKGDIIGITCPAGYMPAQKAQSCITTLQQWGFEVWVGKTVGSTSNNYFSGTDESRLNEFQAMLDDNRIKAILCGRGGYGTGRIIDQLNFKRFKKNPKWIIGFSDITVLHCHLYAQLHTASLHAPMASAFNDGGANEPYVQSLRACLTGKKPIYRAAAHPLNKSGKVTAPIVGGNLSLLINQLGTPSEPNTKNTILFLEDIGEQLYSIDRMLHQLKRAGKLDGLKGMILGGFTDIKDTDRPFGESIDALLYNLFKEYDFPICYHFPISHNKENYSIKIGAIYTLNINKKLEVRLHEN